MKTLLISGLALTLLAGSALAQAAPQPAPDGGAAASAGAPSATAAAPMGRPVAPPPGGMAGPQDPPPPPHGGPGVPPPPSRAAHILLRNGDRVLDLKCADDEPTKACADVALHLLDALGPAKATP